MKRFLEENEVGKESIFLSVEEEQIEEHKQQEKRVRRSCLVTK